MLPIRNLLTLDLETVMPNLTEDDIRSKAYELWEQAGCPDGGAEIYWAQAQMTLGRGENALPPDSSASFDSSEERPAGHNAADKTTQ